MKQTTHSLLLVPGTMNRVVFRLFRCVAGTACTEDVAAARAGVLIRNSLIVLMALATGTVGRAAETQADFFVSVSGSDSWSGTQATPNAQRTDGPFATLERARDAVRELKNGKSNDIVVLVT